MGLRLPSIPTHSLGPKQSKISVGGTNSRSTLLPDKVMDTRAARVVPRAPRPLVVWKTLLVQPRSSKFHENPDRLCFMPGDCRRGHNKCWILRESGGKSCSGQALCYICERLRWQMEDFRGLVYKAQPRPLGFLYLAHSGVTSPPV